MPSDMEIKTLICEIGKLMYDRGYVVINDGNISARADDGNFWVTPSGVSKGRMTPDMMVKVDIDGNVLEGNRYPSSEVKMHLVAYKKRADVGAVVHAHPPLGTSFAICRKAIDKRYLPEMLVGLGPVPVAEFAMPSTQEVPDSVEPYIEGYNAVLLANHGVLTWGDNLWQAFDRLEVVESSAKVIMSVEQIGGGVEISQKDTDTLLSFLDNYKKLAGKRG